MCIRDSDNTTSVVQFGPDANVATEGHVRFGSDGALLSRDGSTDYAMLDASGDLLVVGAGNSSGGSTFATTQLTADDEITLYTNNSESSINLYGVADGLIYLGIQSGSLMVFKSTGIELGGSGNVTPLQWLYNHGDVTIEQLTYDTGSGTQNAYDFYVKAQNLGGSINGTGGTLFLYAGDSNDSGAVARNGGDVVLRGGAKSNAGNDGAIIFQTEGASATELARFDNLGSPRLLWNGDACYQVPTNDAHIFEDDSEILRIDAQGGSGSILYNRILFSNITNQSWIEVAAASSGVGRDFRIIGSDAGGTGAYVGGHIRFLAGDGADGTTQGGDGGNIYYATGAGGSGTTPGDYGEHIFGTNGQNFLKILLDSTLNSSVIEFYSHIANTIRVEDTNTAGTANSLDIYPASNSGTGTGGTLKLHGGVGGTPGINDGIVEIYNGATLIATFDNDGLNVVGELHTSLLNTISPASFSTQQDDYNPTGWDKAQVVRLTTGANADVTGFSATVTDKMKYIINIGSNNVILKHQDGNSSAANRIIISGDVDLVLQPNDSVGLVYDSVAARWRCI